MFIEKTIFFVDVWDTCLFTCLFLYWLLHLFIELFLFCFVFYLFFLLIDVFIYSFIVEYECRKTGLLLQLFLPFLPFLFIFSLTIAMLIFMFYWFLNRMAQRPKIQACGVQFLFSCKARASCWVHNSGRNVRGGTEQSAYDSLRDKL